jgi:hypothetical protein
MIGNMALLSQYSLSVAQPAFLPLLVDPIQWR